MSNTPIKERYQKGLAFLSEYCDDSGKVNITLMREHRDQLLTDKLQLEAQLAALQRENKELERALRQIIGWREIDGYDWQGLVGVIEGIAVAALRQPTEGGEG